MAKKKKGKPQQKKQIPAEVREKAEEVIARFNRENFPDGNVKYMARFQGNYLFLDRSDYGSDGKICRLKYTGDFENWDFAIYKYSDGDYDPDEWLFPGDEEVDGSIEGAMRAGLKAYPP